VHLLNYFSHGCANMQARDRLGRPLRGASIATDSFPQVPEREFISSKQAWSEITEYLAADLPFHVHEVAEQRWRCAPTTDAALWQACAQMGAALTHHARGNDIGAARLAERARITLATATSHAPEVNSVVLEILFSVMLEP
jgi:hypothetical protein